MKKKRHAEEKGMIACIEILDAVITNIKESEATEEGNIQISNGYG